MRSWLIGEKRDRRALPAAFNYLIMGTIGATFYVDRPRLPLCGNRHAQHGSTWLRGSRRLTTVDCGAGGLCVRGRGARHQGGDVPAAWLAARALTAYAPSLISVSSRRHGDQGVDLLMARFVFDVFPDTARRSGRRFVTWVLAPLAATGAIVCSMQAVFEKRNAADDSPSHRWRRWGSSCSAFRSRAAAGFIGVAVLSWWRMR
jgi:multicomponent Na+:H+ antiporter subunit D